MPPAGEEHPRREGPLADLTSGVMWLTTAAIGLAVLVLPGSGRAHVGRARGLCEHLGRDFALVRARPCREPLEWNPSLIGSRR